MPSSPTSKRSRSDIAGIEEAYRDLWRKLGHEPPAHGINDPGPRRGMVTYQDVELRDGVYRHTFTENGACHQLQETRDPGQLMEWLAIQVASTLSMKHVNELKPRPKDQFKAMQLKQVELLARLDPEWAARRKAELFGSKR
jgi:hypothetical protein